MIRNKEEWLSAMREASLHSDHAIEQKDGRWRLTNRVEAWKEAAPKLFDDYLDRFQSLAIRVFRAKDPQFEIEPERRFMARAEGKTLPYSTSLRKGMAETLGLLGSYPEFVTSTTRGKAVTTAAAVVRGVLRDTDWKTWASVNDYLPMFAEAAPEEFLAAVEAALDADPSPFVEIFAQERAGLTGRNYMTGVLWALETLGWSGDYLLRVVELVGDLASIDPGGNWSNRPFNSIVDILLPWHPQTVAEISKRVAAVRVLVKEHPAVAWRLLLALMPEAHSVTSGTRKPTWRKFIPPDWPEAVTNRDYWQQVNEYAAIALELAKSDSAKLPELLDRIGRIPDPTRAEVLNYLRSAAVRELPEAERRPIWEELMKLVSVHRQYADAEWAMDSESVTTLEEIAKSLQPSSPMARHHRLFGGEEFELFEQRDNWEEEERKLQSKRQEAVIEIFSSDGLDALLQFAQSVDAPSKVGDAFGVAADSSVDTRLLPVQIDRDEYKDFVSGFIWARLRSKGWNWPNTLGIEHWTTEQQLGFLLKLPFAKEAWELAESLLKEHVNRYWAAVYPNAYNVVEKDLIEAAKLLLSYGRPRGAIQCLSRLAFQKKEIDPSLVCRALLDAASVDDKGSPLDQHAARQLIKWLQDNASTSADELFKVEWTYLRLLDKSYGGVGAKTLEGRLARDPELFCEVIRLVFRSDKEERKTEVDESKKRLAEQGYRLLLEWTTPPGTLTDGTWNSDAFSKWLTTVRASTKESGHYGVAMSQVGQVLPYVPADPDGLWIDKTVAEALNEKDADELRSGFTIELFNMRGTHGFTHGAEERKIAAGLRAKADAVENVTYHRFAAALRDLAKQYEADAERDAARNPLE